MDDGLESWREAAVLAVLLALQLAVAGAFFWCGWCAGRRRRVRAARARQIWRRCMNSVQGHTVPGPVNGACAAPRVSRAADAPAQPDLWALRERRIASWQRRK